MNTYYRVADLPHGRYDGEPAVMRLSSHDVRLRWSEERQKWIGEEVSSPRIARRPTWRRAWIRLGVATLVAGLIGYGIAEVFFI